MKFTLDRIEEGIAVCFDADGVKYNIPTEKLGDMSEGDIFEAELCEGEVCNIRTLRDETEAKKEENASRLRNLFNRRK